MNEPTLGTVIILNHNAAAMTCAAVEAVLAQTVADRLKVVVVDNGSEDGSAERLIERFGGRISLVRSERNVGFAAGNNLGADCAEGKYLLLLNNDAVPDPSWAEELVQAAEADAAIGMCTSKIVTFADPQVIDCAGHIMYPDGLSCSRGNWRRDGEAYDRPCETLVASGCAALYRREAFLRCGGFDEDFFAYLDDVELGLKIRLAGYRCAYAPAARVRHHGSATLLGRSLEKVFLIERNRVWILLEFFPWSWIARSPWHTVRRLWRSWRHARRGEGRAGALAEEASPLRFAAAVGRGWLAALVGAPGALRKRRRLKSAWPEGFRALPAALRRFRAGTEDASFGPSRYPKGA